MKVTLLAYTEFHAKPVEELNWPDEEFEDADFLAEFAGRACYQSWSRPNPKTATNKGYLANILGMGHESVLEHASATFYIEGVSRALTHELIRHRHLSFSELSQRYVNVEGAKPVIPPAIVSQADMGGLAGTPLDMSVVYNQIGALDRYKDLVEKLIETGLPRKQAREAARAVLPNATETKIVVTGNMRAWRDVLKKRWHVAADAEIRQLAGVLLTELRDIAPNSFQDIPDDPYGSE